MTTAYKLTDSVMRTYGGLQWALNVPQSVVPGGRLCGASCLHTYNHPLVAALMNPIHANFSNPRLFRCECEGRELTDRGLKSGWTGGSVTLLEELPLPEISQAARRRCAIYCAQAVIGDHCPEWSAWATRWLSGEDLSTTSAAAAAAAAAWAAAWATTTTEATAEAAAAAAAAAAWAAAWATTTTEATAEAAAAAAAAAALDIVAIIERAIRDEAAMGPQNGR